ncbi:LysR family transcriptional regulator [Ramlibacter tataouinensis]|uniref:Transcriptional regulator, LysR family-like protein n=1 Tax=Ramlibacter tataouinensis (strain ATCC BAA-407 / DSM 14655 / LMG 21543 / TTB310) TaxID=365046 RepID=F5Y631_RAMTT|nr:LysR family transcriptional regulator [Ramlibacter tataouinensis]AEG91535.1 transcriptional regulator, LysR family-like protein [Ramlibacter tataouinensis TTB310]
MRSLLPDLELFAAIARHGSFRRAAAERKVSTSLVSQGMRKLEDQLGVVLLRRTTRSVAPTAAGAELLVSLEPGLRQIQDAVERINLHRGSPIGALRINAPAPIAQFLLAPLAARFTREHPDVAIEIVAEAARQDIVLEGFDAGVRFGKDVPQDMVAVRIGQPQRYAIVASPRYLRDVPEPRAPRELKRHECIRRRFPAGTLQAWEFQRRIANVEVPVGRIVVNDAQIAVNAAVAGGGLAYVHEKYVEREIAAGELVRLLEPWSPGIGVPYLYYPRQRYLSAALRAFIDLARMQAPAVD